MNILKKEASMDLAAFFVSYVLVLAGSATGTMTEDRYLLSAADSSRRAGSQGSKAHVKCLLTLAIQPLHADHISSIGRARPRRAGGEQHESTGVRFESNFLAA
jgi:hypothetical protein